MRPKDAFGLILYYLKVFLTGGATGLSLDCVSEWGSSNDMVLFPLLLQRQEGLYDGLPWLFMAEGGSGS